MAKYPSERAQLRNTQAALSDALRRVEEQEAQIVALGGCSTVLHVAKEGATDADASSFVGKVHRFTSQPVDLNDFLGDFFRELIERSVVRQRQRVGVKGRARQPSRHGSHVERLLCAERRARRQVGGLPIRRGVLRAAAVRHA